LPYEYNRRKQRSTGRQCRRHGAASFTFFGAPCADLRSKMIRIAIVDDHAVVRAGLRQYFGDQIDFDVVAEASNGREALNIVRQGEVDVILMDISMPDQSGVDALLAIRARAPELPVLILSGFPEEHYATTLLRQGASGYLNKDCDPEEIVRAIRTVYRGRKYITPGVAERLAEGLGGAGDGPPHEQLSERELQVFLRLAKGETIGHMAHSMSLSVKTVSTYRTRVMEKMQLASNSDLTYYALKNGLIQ
jgi:two-component system, NarL family, invasion response regulator UvrY